jgi:hypothetical protein
MTLKSIFILGAFLGLATAPAAPAPAADQAMDQAFAAHAKAWTTKPEFISPLVDHLPLATTVPSPSQILGHDIGAPRILDHYADILAYYRALAAKTGRIKIIETGLTEEGRPTVVVLISSEANIAALEENRRNLVRLGDPRGLAETDAKALIAKTKPIYLALGGLHSAETGPPEMLMELAYRLITEDSPLIQKIRDNVIVGINPASDPDGRDRYTDWYYKNKIDDTDDLDPVPGAPYWGKYIFHDNNRDINYSGYSARNLLKFYLDWRPQIIHDLHESVPFLYIFSGQPPQNPGLDPILYSELPWFSNFEMAKLKSYGMPGVWDHGYVDAWSPGYVAFMSSNHNGLIRFYETFGNGGATTELRHVKPVDGPGEDFHARDQTKREWYRPDPPYATVDWSMRDNTNFMETGLLTALETTATFPQLILEDFYRKSRNSLEDGAKTAPYAYVIPADQPDMTRAALLINLLRRQGIEVGRAEGPVKIKEGTFPAGSLIIKRNQPYGRLAKILLEKQTFPDPKLKTYDDSAWTMGLMAHVKVVPSADLTALDIPVTPVDQYVAPSVIAAPGAPAYAVLDEGSINLASLRYALKDVSLRIAESDFTAEGRTVPAGSFIVPGGAYERLKVAAAPLGLTVVSLPGKTDAPAHIVGLPRVALYSTWGSTQNVGWVRFAFDQFNTPYDLIFKDELRHDALQKGGLRARYDVIIIPSQGRSPKDLVFDIPLRGKPLPYEKSAQFKFLGDYGASPDIRGGMGYEGLEALKTFVAEGGTLITLGDSSALPGAFGLAPEVEVSHTSKDFYAPGPIVNARILAPKNPIFYGYADKTVSVRWATDSLLALPARDRDLVLMDFPGGAKNVLSGLMNGADEAKNHPAIVEEPVGQGRIVMFATNPVYRWQNFGEFRMLYNAIFNYQQLGLGLSTAPAVPVEAPAGEAAVEGGG